MCQFTVSLASQTFRFCIFRIKTSEILFHFQFTLFIHCLSEQRWPSWFDLLFCSHRSKLKRARVKFVLTENNEKLCSILNDRYITFVHIKRNMRTLFLCPFHWVSWNFFPPFFLLVDRPDFGALSTTFSFDAIWFTKDGKWTTIVQSQGFKYENFNRRSSNNKSISCISFALSEPKGILDSNQI